MTLDVRYTKFPYIFWTSSKPISTEIDFQKGTLKTDKGNYNFAPMKIWAFFLIKYLPVLLIFIVLYNRYDLEFSVPKMVSYIFAVLYFVPLVLFDDFVRRFLLLAMVFVAFVLGFFIGDSNVGAFSLKYFVFLFAIFIFVADLQYRPFKLFKNGKIYSHFLIKKELIKGGLNEKSKI